MTTTQPSPSRPGLDLIDDPHAHLSAALVVSLALWVPFGLAVIRGELPVLAAGLRYLVAFVGCRCAIAGIARLHRSYRHLALAATTPEPSADITQDPGATAPAPPDAVSPRGG